jgi:hypothetical protein
MVGGAINGTVNNSLTFTDDDGVDDPYAVFPVIAPITADHTSSQHTDVYSLALDHLVGSDNNHSVTNLYDALILNRRYFLFSWVRIHDEQMICDMSKKAQLSLFSLMILIAIVATLLKVATIAMVPKPGTSSTQKYGYSIMKKCDIVFVCRDTYLPDGNQIYDYINDFKGEGSTERAQAWASRKYYSLPMTLRITPEEIKIYKTNNNTRTQGSMTTDGPWGKNSQQIALNIFNTWSRSHAPRGNAIRAAPRPLLGTRGRPTQSVEGGIPTRSVGTRLSRVTREDKKAWG